MVLFLNSADEPDPQDRSVVFQVTGDGNVLAMCSVLIPIQLINNHPPIVDLNGAAMGTNYSLTVPFNPLASSISVAALDATISDGDGGSKVVTLDLVLSAGQPGDRLTSNLCTPSSYNSSCYLK